MSHAAINYIMKTAKLTCVHNITTLHKRIPQLQKLNVTGTHETKQLKPSCNCCFNSNL